MMHEARGGTLGALGTARIVGDEIVLGAGWD
jgi:hypothetical protein